MPDPFSRFRARKDDVRIGTALVLSIVVHAAALAVLMPRFPGQPPWPGPGDGAPAELVVELAARAAMPTASPVRVEAPPMRGPHRASAPARTAPTSEPVAPRPMVHGTQVSREPLAVMTAPTPQAPAPIPSAQAEHAPWWRPTSAALAHAKVAPSVGGDLSSYVAARRRERAEEPPAAKTESGGRERIFAGKPAPQSPIEDARRQRGGLFAITRMAYDDAEFLFYGWKDDAGGTPTQAFQVRLGANRDMRIAVVRRMIALIREHEQGDFRWQSWRLGSVLTLSARPEDSVGLEDFLLREFFPVGPR